MKSVSLELESSEFMRAMIAEALAPGGSSVYSFRNALSVVNHADEICCSNSHGGVRYANDSSIKNLSVSRSRSFLLLP